MDTYKTKSGDMYDYIAFQKYGDCKYTEKLLNANRDKLENFIFSAGTELNIPDISADKINSLPPWKS